MLAVITVLSTIAQSQASTLSQKKKQLYRIRKRLRKVKNRLRFTRVRKRDISHQLHRTQRQIRKLETDISGLSKQITYSKHGIKKLRSELKVLQANYDKKQELVQKRLRDIYLNDNNDNFLALLESSNFSDFVNHSNYLSLVSESDQQLLKTLKLQQQAIQFKQLQIKNKYKRMLSYRGRLKVKRHSLEKIEDKREELLSEVEKERKFYARKKYVLEEHTHEIEQQVQRMIRAYQRRRRRSRGRSYTPRHSTGRFRWPTPGYVTSPFGYRRHPIFGGWRMHTGIDIGVGYGVPIKASDGGTVIHSSWCGGYGYTIIIDHGKGITTLYAHCSRLIARKGQSVGKGQVIAAVGSTGYSTGPHLHFEVRQNGVPVNPMGYLK